MGDNIISYAISLLIKLLDQLGFLVIKILKVATPIFFIFFTYKRQEFFVFSTHIILDKSRFGRMISAMPHTYDNLHVRHI